MRLTTLEDSASSLATGGSIMRISQWLGLLAILLMTTAIQLRVTWQGVGLSPDSVSYMLIARGIESGDGYAIRSIDGTVQPQSHWPPLYPLVLAAGMRLGIDPTDTVYGLHAVLIAINLMLVGWIARRVSNQSPLAMVLAMLLLATSTELYAIHVMLASEPLFVMLMLAGVILLEQSARDPRLRMLVMAGMLLGLAWLTRYAGVGMIVVGMGWVLWSLRKLPLRRRMIVMGVYLLCAVVPMLLWIVRGLWQSGSVGNRRLLWHPPGRTDLQRLFDTLAAWWIGGIYIDPRYAPWLAMGLVLLVGGAWWLLIRSNTSGTHSRRISNLIASMIVGYVLFLLASVTLFDAYTQLDFRTLLPVQTLAIPLLCGGVAILLSRFNRRMVRGMVVIAALIFFSARCVGLMRWVDEAPVQSLGYLSKGWRESSLMKAVAQLPDAPWIYSNRSDAIYACTGRLAIPLPIRFNPTQERVNDELPEQLAKIQQHINQRWAYVVIVRRAGLDYLIAEKELRTIGRLRVIERHRQGTIYRLSASARDVE